MENRLVVSFWYLIKHDSLPKMKKTEFIIDKIKIAFRLDEMLLGKKSILISRFNTILKKT